MSAQQPSTSPTPTKKKFSTAKGKKSISTDEYAEFMAMKEEKKAREEANAIAEEKRQASAAEKKAIRDDYEDASGITAKNEQIKVIQAEITALKEARKELYGRGSGGATKSTDEQKQAKKARAAARKAKTASGSCIKCPNACGKSFMADNAHYHKHVAKCGK